MKYSIIIILSILLVGCAVSQENVEEKLMNEEVTIGETNENEALASSFKLSAAQGFVKDDNYEVPHTYIIDPDKLEVFVHYQEEGFTDEDREMITNMSDEEAEEYSSNQPEYEEPIYGITFLEAKKDEIVMEYEGEQVVFIALSDSYYKTEARTQYIIEDGVTISNYKNNFLE